MGVEATKRCRPKSGHRGFDLSQASYGFNWLENNYIVERNEGGGSERSSKKEKMLQPEGSFQSSLYHCIFLTDVGETRRPLLVSKICLTLTVFFSFPFCSLFTSGLPFFLHRHKNSQTVISHDMHGDAYLALATSSVSEKMKRCLSCVCRPVFSCAWAWPRNRRPGHSARKLWTRGQDSGLTGVRQLSLEGRTQRNTHTKRQTKSSFSRYPQRR